METETRKPSRVRRSPGEWQQLVEGWQNSGLSQKAWCQREGIALSTFCRWRERLSKDAMSEADFVELSVPAPVSTHSSWQVELELGSGVVLRLARDS